MRYLAVKTKSSAKVSKARARKKFEQLNCCEVKEVPHLRWKRVEVPEELFEEVFKRLSEDPDIEKVEEEGVSTICTVSGEVDYGRQWFHKRIGTDRCRSLSMGNPAIKIAVVDTGVDHNHPDLVGKVLAGKNVIDNTTNTIPTATVGYGMAYHGTSVASCIVAAINEGAGIAGVVPNCKIVPVLAGSTKGFFQDIDSAEGITWAADNGCFLINCSFGGDTPTTAKQDAINYAIGKGCMIIAAAGNDGIVKYGYPSSFDGVLSVAASDQFDEPTFFTTLNDKIALAAPGITIRMADLGGKYHVANGTSFACPITVGAAALLKSIKDSLTPSEIRALLVNNTDPWSNQYGAGILNLFRSATAVALTLPQYSDSVFAWVNVKENILGGTRPTIFRKTKLELLAVSNNPIVSVELRIDGKTVYAGAPIAEYELDPNVWEEGRHTLSYTAASSVTSDTWSTEVDLHKLTVVVESSETPSVSEFTADEPINGVIPVKLGAPPPAVIAPVVSVKYTDKNHSGINCYANGSYIGTNYGDFELDLSDYDGAVALRFDVQIPLQSYPPDATSRFNGTSVYTYSVAGDVVLPVQGALTAPSVQLRPVVAAPSLTGSVVSTGSISAASVSLTPTVAVGTLSGPVATVGIIAAPSVSLRPSVSPATLSGVQVGSMTVPAVTLRPSVAVGTLTGVESVSVGSIAAASTTMQIQVNPPTLRGVTAGTAIRAPDGSVWDLRDIYGVPLDIRAVA